MKLNRKTRIGLAVVSSVALIGVAGAAYASPPWVINDGANTSGTVPYTAVADTSISPTVSFVTGAADMSCDSSTASGDITLGATPSSGPDTGKFGTIKDISFGGCQAFGILDMEVVDLPDSSDPTNFPAWKLKVTDDAVSGVSDGEVYSIHAHVQDTGTEGDVCRMDVGGHVTAKFDANTQKLIVSGSQLNVSNMVGCLDAPGPKATFKATYDVSGGDFGVTP